MMQHIIIENLPDRTLRLVQDTYRPGFAAFRTAKNASTIHCAITQDDLLRRSYDLWRSFIRPSGDT